MIEGVFPTFPTASSKRQTAYCKAFKAVESLYDCRCRVIVRKKLKSADGSVRFENEVLYEGLPCRISYEAISSAKKSSRQERLNFTRKNDTLAEEISATVKLFFSPSADIPPGSEIVVFKEGAEFHYVSAGIAAVYPGHKEIVLVSREEFA